jgi:hypothetical protein
MKYLANIVLMVFSLVLFFGALELCVRYFSPEQTASKAKMPEAFKGVVVLDDKLGYRLASQHPVADRQTVDFNHRTVTVSKPANTFRIICVGGSTTMGVNNPLDSYPAILQSLFDYALAGCERKVEVLNAGMMGYHSWHSLLRAETELDALSPDMYLLMDGLNDVMAAATIEDIDEAIKQREIFTQLVNAPAKSKPLILRLFQALDHLAFYRLAKREYSAFMLPDVMERKMTAFGFRNNVETFIKDRLSKGIGVTLINYGWITRDKASPQEESARIPYDFNIPLYQFGRDYVNRILSDTSKKFNVPLIDLQVLIDALSNQTPLLYRVFTDEMHYTPFADYMVAHHIYTQLLQNRAIEDFLGGCTLPSLSDVDAHFAYRLAWGEYSLGYGFPPAGSKPVRVLNIESRNVVFKNGDDCIQNWCPAAPGNLTEEGVVTLRLLLEDRKGWLAYLPRIFSNRGFVTVETMRDGHWTPVSNLVKYHDDGQWTPIEARYGFRTDALPPGEATVRIRLLGKAQIFQRDGNFFFYQAR